MREPTKITVDDLLKESPRVNTRLAAMADASYSDAILFGHTRPWPVRRRFDPRRLLDRMLRPSPPSPPMPAGRIIYSATEADDPYSQWPDAAK